MRNEGLNIFLHLLRDSISNRASCVRVGTLGFLLDWFPCEDKDWLRGLICANGGCNLPGGSLVFWTVLKAFRCCGFGWGCIKCWKMTNSGGFIVIKALCAEFSLGGIFGKIFWFFFGCRRCSEWAVGSGCIRKMSKSWGWFASNKKSTKK